MYISRPTLENELKRELTGSKHIIIHGESGSGKSWLYKKVLNELSMEWELVNLAISSTKGSIAEEFRSIYFRQVDRIKSGYTEKKSAELSAGVAKGTLDHVGQYTIPEKDPIEGLFEVLSKKAGNKRSAVVLDNLESIFNNEDMMRELGNLLILLDDDYYSQFNIRFIVVGVPTGVREYFARAENRSTISNRLSEISEVAKLDRAQVEEFSSKGLLGQLDIKFPSSNLYDKYIQSIYWVTNGIPQRLHEYCLELSYLCQENNWEAKEEFLSIAIRRWIKKSLSKNYVVIDEIMNSKETSVGRRNQVLYSLGLIETSSFNNNDIEEIVRNEFPKSTQGITLNIAQTLNAISEYPDTPIKRTPKGNAWVFTDPMYLMCIRGMLYKTEDEKVDKIELSEL